MKQIIIIGAPRSGTNMLRNVITMLPGFGTWPCDEINYIWRHNNATYHSDEFTAELATKKVKKYINRQFKKLAKKNQLHYVVDKTIANSLRIGFVDHIFPDAKYIYIVRNGIDVVDSFMKKKSGSKNMKDILKKIRYVPTTDFPYYGLRFVKNRIYSFFSAKNRDAYWGPNIEAMDEIVRNYNLAEVCALQWKKCVDMADHDFDQIPDNRKLYLKYETFVEDPVRYVRNICTFTGTEFPETVKTELTNYVFNKSVGKGIKGINYSDSLTIGPLIEDTLRRHGYD